jgi:hypothetical protein
MTAPVSVGPYSKQTLPIQITGIQDPFMARNRPIDFEH